MPETKSQRTLQLEEEARLEREKDDEAAKGEKEPGPGGADDDSPEEDNELAKHTSKLDNNFETLLRIIFKV